MKKEISPYHFTVTRCEPTTFAFKYLMNFNHKFAHKNSIAAAIVKVLGLMNRLNQNPFFHLYKFDLSHILTSTDKSYEIFIYLLNYAELRYRLSIYQMSLIHAKIHK